VPVADAVARTARRKANGEVPDYSDPKQAAAFATAAAFGSGPCGFAEPVPGFKRVELGLSHDKNWNRCTNPTKPLGGAEYVCPCQGCGPPCKGYLSEDAADVVRDLHRFAANVPPYPEGKFSGRGVVICGGGKYWPSAYVAVRMLRHHGCTLPAQVWHLGEPERDDRYTRLLAPHGVEVVDMLAHPAAGACRNLTGFPGHSPFQVKSFAVLHSPFREVFSLDADAYPVGDLTQVLDDPMCRHFGGVYWPDGDFTNAWTRWAQWGVKPFGPNMGFETGLYAIDKQKAWRPLNVARWIDDHGDTFYGKMIHHDHGDKGSHRVGWAICRQQAAYYTLTHQWAGGIAFIQPGPDGVTPLVIHRALSKLSLKHEVATFASTPQAGPNVRVGLPGEAQAFAYLDELRRLLG
jgi:hypothetical protein